MTIRSTYGSMTGNGAYGIADWDENAKDWGIHLALGYKASDMFTIEAGYGHQESKLKDDYKVKADVFYINAPITLAKNVWIIPEIGMESFKESDNGVKLGKVGYFGAKWQINF